MKTLSLLLWVSQFGLSIIFPTLFFLLLAVYLQTRLGLGMWIIWVLGFFGVLTSIQTTKSCLRSLKKAAQEASPDKPAPISFNDHQ